MCVFSHAQFHKKFLCFTNTVDLGTNHFYIQMHFQCHSDKSLSPCEKTLQDAVTTSDLTPRYHYHSLLSPDVNC